MKTSDSIVNISKALLEAQKKIGSAKKDAVNPFFHSNYADLGSVMDACKDALNEQGITVLQPVGTDELGVYVETVLLHSSGEWISDKLNLAVKEQNNPQAQGSAISYARRYGLQSMVFIPSEDDDAEKATRPVAKMAAKSISPSNGASKCYDCGAPIGKPHATGCSSAKTLLTEPI